MEPLRVLMKELLTVSGSAWERVQQEKHFDESQSVGFGDLRQRDYRMLLAAHNKHEGCCIQSLSNLFFADAEWEAVPAGYRRADVQHLCFTLVSRAAAEVQRYLIDHHRGYPYKMGRLFDDLSLADEVRGIAELL
eukprot:9476002-Pyramimonas_sp.AAC.1